MTKSKQSQIKNPVLPGRDMKTGGRLVTTVWWLRQGSIGGEYFAPNQKSRDLAGKLCPVPTKMGNKFY